MQGVGNKCVKEASTALPILHRAELLKEHEQVMQVMVMHSLVTHLGRNGWAAILLKGTEALRWINTKVTLQDKYKLLPLFVPTAASSEGMW